VITSNAEWTPKVSVTTPAQIVYEVESQPIVADDQEVRSVNFRVWRDYKASEADDTHEVGEPIISGFVRWDGCAHFDDEHSTHICDLVFIEDRLHIWREVYRQAYDLLDMAEFSRPSD